MAKYIAWAKKNYLLFVLLWAGMVLIFSYSGVPGGLDVDSCNYAAVSKEVLRTNNWLGLYDPVYQGVFYYHFPLCIWITAGIFKIIGVTTFAAKLFSMLSGVLLVAAIFFLGRIIKNEWVGFFSALSFLMTNHIVRLSRQCRMDIPVSLFITLALFCFILAQRRSRYYYLLFGLSTCLAIFTKDVFGLAPLAIVFIYLILVAKWKEFFHPLFISGLVVALGPVLLWICLDKSSLFTPWFHWNFMHLLKSPGFHVPWYYYASSLVNKYFYFLPFAVYGGYLAVKESYKKKDYVAYILIIWALIFPLAFSFGRQKLHYFILPIYPAASVLVGTSLDRLLKESIKMKTATILKYVLIIGTIIMLCFPLEIRSKRFEETVRLAPHIDQILKQLPRYDFYVYNQDAAAILFYSQELKRVKVIKDLKSLEEVLSAPAEVARFCYLSEQDFLGVSASGRQMCRLVLRYKDKVIIVNPKDQELTINIPR